VLIDRNRDSAISWFVICEGKNRSTAISLSVSSAAGWAEAGRGSRPSNLSRIRLANPAHRLDGEIRTARADLTAGPAATNAPQASSGSARARASARSSAACCPWVSRRLATTAASSAAILSASEQCTDDSASTGPISVRAPLSSSMAISSFAWQMATSARARSPALVTSVSVARAFSSSPAAKLISASRTASAAARPCRLAGPPPSSTCTAAPAAGAPPGRRTRPRTGSRS